MEELLLAESKRVVELLIMLNELPLPEYNRDWKWDDKDYKKYRNIKELRSPIKNELKNRLTMLRKDCILVRKQLEEER